MQLITRDEAIAIRNKLRGVNVVVTNRHAKSKAKSYYTEDSNYVNKFLAQYRSRKNIEHFE